MATIVTRAGKGSALTHTEGDSNFTNLNNDKMESFTLAGDSGTSQTIQNSNTLTIAGGTGLSSVASATDTVTINLDNTAVTPASYTNANITVDAQGRITAASNGSGSSFAPASPGEIGASTPDIGNFTDLKVKAASSTVKELQLYDQDNSNYVGFKSPTNVGANKVWTLPSTDGTANHVLTTDGAGNLSWAAASGGGNLNDLTDVNITSPVNTQVLAYQDGQWSNQNASTFAAASPGEIGASTPADASFLHLNVKSASSIVKELRLHDEDNSNYVGFKSPTNVGSNRIYTLPSTDGTNGHFLKTDGTGGLSWSAAGGGGNLNDLTDVTITTPTNTQVLAYNNGIWVNQNASTFAVASPGEIGASTPDVGNFTDLKVKSASSTVKELQLHDQDNSNYVGFKAPTTVSTNKVWVLPNADGTNGQVLSTNGSATLSWATAGGANSFAILQANASGGNLVYTNTSEATIDANWTEVSDINSIVSVSGDEFTISSAGTYIIEVKSPQNITTDYTGTDQVTSPSITIKLRQGGSTIADWYSWEETQQNSTSTALTSILGQLHIYKTVTLGGSTSFDLRRQAQGATATNTITIQRNVGILVFITKIA